MDSHGHEILSLNNYMYATPGTGQKFAAWPFPIHARNQELAHTSAQHSSRGQQHLIAPALKIILFAQASNLVSARTAWDCRGRS